MTRRILITGASGFVGRHLVAELLGCDCELFLLVRTGAKAAFADLAVTVIEHSSIERYRGEGLPATLDCVVHLAAKAHVTEKPEHNSEYQTVNVAGTRAVCAVARQTQATHFVYMSSIKVNAEETDATPLTEEDVEAPAGIYAETKLQAEQVARELIEEGVRVSIVRPPLVYGGHVKANMAALVKLVRWLPILPFGDIANRRSFISVSNLCDFLRTLAFETPAEPYQAAIFMVSDNEMLSTAQLCQVMATSLRKTRIIAAVPRQWLARMCELLGQGRRWRKLTASLCVKGVNAHRYYGWVPSRSAVEEITAFIQEQH